MGSAIRSQRELADLSMRQLAKLADISSPYLSQIERGLHEPSLRVVRALAAALNTTTESLLAHAGLSGDTLTLDTELAIRSDPRLSDAQRSALLSVYRSYRSGAAGT